MQRITTSGAQTMDHFAIAIASFSTAAGIIIGTLYTLVARTMYKKESDHSRRVMELEAQHMKALATANDLFITQLKEENARDLPPIYVPGAMRVGRSTRVLRGWKEGELASPTGTP